MTEGTEAHLTECLKNTAFGLQEVGGVHEPSH
jgi:hypothetical protein